MNIVYVSSHSFAGHDSLIGVFRTEDEANKSILQLYEELVPGWRDDIYLYNERYEEWLRNNHLPPSPNHEKEFNDFMDERDQREIRRVTRLWENWVSSRQNNHSRKPLRTRDEETFNVRPVESFL